MFGLGYKRLDVSNLFGNENSAKAIVNESPAASLLFPMGVPGQKKKGITGQVIYKKKKFSFSAVIELLFTIQDRIFYYCIVLCSPE